MAADTNELEKRLANYPNFFPGHTEKCESLEMAAHGVALMKDEKMSSKNIMDEIKKNIRDNDIPAESEELFRLLVEIAFSESYSDKSSEKFRDNVEHQCKTAEVRFCDAEIEAAVFVGKAKAEGASHSDYVANEWCAKYSKDERRAMFNKRDDEVQGVSQ